MLDYRIIPLAAVLHLRLFTEHTHTNTHTFTHILTYAHTNTHSHTLAYTYSYILTHTFTHNVTYTHTLTHTYTNVCVSNYFKNSKNFRRSVPENWVKVKIHFSYFITQPISGEEQRTKKLWTCFLHNSPHSNKMVWISISVAWLSLWQLRTACRERTPEQRGRHNIDS